MTPSVPPPELPAAARQLLECVKSDRHSVLSPGSQTHKNLFIASAPGQLDVLGGETACIGGTFLTCPIGVGATVGVQRRDDQKILIRNYPADGAAGVPENTIELSLGDFYGTAALLPQETLRSLFAGPRQWAAFIAGVFPILARHKKLTRRSAGANIVCTYAPELAPVGAKTALACAALSAIAAAYHLILEPSEIAQLADRVQHQIAASTCAQLADALTAVLARQDHLLLIKAQPHEVLGQLPLPASLRLYAIALPETPARSPLAGSAASVEVAQQIISRMYRDLGLKKDPTGGYLANVSPALYRRYFRGMLPEQIAGREFLAEFKPEGDPRIHPDSTYAPRAAADHALAEIDRAGKFAELLRNMPTASGSRRQAEIAAGLLLAESQSHAPAPSAHSAAATLLQGIARKGIEQGLLGARLARSAAGTVVTILADATDRPRIVLEELVRTVPAGRLITDSHPGAGEGVPARIPVPAL